jgi:hypothetical protein
MKTTIGELPTFTIAARKGSALMPGIDSPMTGMLDAFRTSQKLC